MYISASRHLACTQFIGARREDTDYLYGFTVSIPLPSYCSWLMHQAPRWFLTLSLYAMFVIEVVLPFGFLAPGWLRPASGASAIFLMCIIHFTGNWGHFNLLTAVVAVSTFDLQAPCTPSLAPLYVGRAGVRGGCAGCVREKGRCACCSARELYPPPRYSALPAAAAIVVAADADVGHVVVDPLHSGPCLLPTPTPPSNVPGCLVTCVRL